MADTLAHVYSQSIRAIGEHRGYTAEEIDQAVDAAVKDLERDRLNASLREPAAAPAAPAADATIPVGDRT